MPVLLLRLASCCLMTSATRCWQPGGNWHVACWCTACRAGTGCTMASTGTVHCTVWHTLWLPSGQRCCSYPTQLSHCCFEHLETITPAACASGASLSATFFPDHWRTLALILGFDLCTKSLHFPSSRYPPPCAGLLVPRSASASLTGQQTYLPHAVSFLSQT